MISGISFSTWLNPTGKQRKKKKIRVMFCFGSRGTGVLGKLPSHIGTKSRNLVKSIVVQNSASREVETPFHKQGEGQSH